ncbi:MAG: hypothetical protein AAGG44_17885, partial [Planctomycetota bacterium]
MKIPSVAREHITRGVPAIVVALLAIATAAYGKWGLRNQMMPQYSELLAKSRETYNELDVAQAAQETLIHSGSTVDICYSRLDGMGKETNPWERLEFYEAHVANLKQK